MATANVTPVPVGPQPLAQREAPQLSPELTGEVLGLNLLTRSDHPQRVKRIMRKLTKLMAAADALKARAAALQPPTEAPQAGVQ